ncbi:MAG: DMT family transporter [Gammaproteobacteria bacterium]|nr:DMT family transporter [Gammaproteobacteria bacterium]MDH3505753.1 DMT family transporter [Gammaproteobacteria bacterium]
MTAQVLALVLLAACIHATWNTWLKLSGDRLVVMALMGTGWALFAACWLPFLEPVTVDAWPYLAVSVVVHLAYTLLLVPAYRLVDLSVAYPMIRGTGPVFVTLVSLLALGEAVGLFGWTAVLLITGGVLALGLGGVAGDYRALLFGLLGGALVAGYTVIDGVGARVSGSALTYAAWLFLLTGIPLPVIGVIAHRGDFVRLARPIAARGLIAGAIASTAFAIVIWSLTQAPLGLVAAARETSVVLVAIAGGVLLKEKVNWVAIAVVFVGVVLLRFAGN